MRRATIVIATLILTLASSMALAQGEAKEDTSATKIEYKLANVVAKVNDRVITDDQLYQRLFKLYGAQVLGQMISEMLVEDEAEARGVSVSDKELAARLAELRTGFADTTEFSNWLVSQRLTTDDLMRQLRLGMLQEQVIVAARGLTVTPQEVDTFFTVNKERLGTPELFHCSHILVPTEAEAEEVVIALEAGADFAKLASLKSQDPATKDQGGDIGFVALAALAPELQQAVSSLEAGATSGVVASNAGFHTIKLMEKKAAVPAVLDKKMREELTKGILKAKVDAAMPELMRELQSKASISLSGVAGSP
jgi:foldase protein PrsA